VSFTDDWLVVTTGGELVLVTSVAETLTSPLRCPVLVIATEIVPVLPGEIVAGEPDEKEKSPVEPNPNIEPNTELLNGVSPKPTVSSPAPAKPTKRTDSNRACLRTFII